MTIGAIKDRQYNSFKESPSRGAPYAAREVFVGNQELNPVPISHPGYMVDPTSRLRVSNPTTLFSNKNVHDSNGSVMKELVSGAGASITYLMDESSVQLEVGTAEGERVVRQSRHIPYVPGKGIRAQLTGKFSTGKANNVQIIGYLDDTSGLAFIVTESGIGVLERTSTTGITVDNIVYQENWNIDVMDGTGSSSNPSGILLDYTKTQLYYFDALWQGVARRRFGLDIGGKIIFVHYRDTANIDDVVYFDRPSLPLRYEIRNTGITASATSMKEICCQTDSEGGYQIPGVEFSGPVEYFSKSIGVTAVPILAIRLKATLLSGKDNRTTIRFLGARVNVTGNNDAWVTLHHVHDPTFTVGSEWVSAGDFSAVEYNSDITSITSTVNHCIDSGPVSSTKGGGSSQGQTTSDIFNEHGLITMNIDATQSQAFVIYARSTASSTDITASLTWTEFD